MPTRIEQIEGQLAATTDDAERIGLLNDLVNEIFRTDPHRSLRLAEEAHHLALALGDRAGEARSLQSMARSHETVADYAAALSAARRALSLYEKLDDQSQVAFMLKSIGSIAFNATDYALALETLERAVPIFQQLNERRGLAGTLNNIGTANEAIGNFDRAIEAYLQGLRIHEEDGNEIGAAIITGNIGNTYYYLKDHDRALEYYTGALEMYQRLDNAFYIAMTLGNITSIYNARGDYAAALAGLEQSLAIFHTIGAQRNEAMVLSGLGITHELRDEPKAALERFRAASKLAESIGIQDTVADVQLRIGILYSKRQNYRRAITALRRGLAFLNGISIERLESEIHEALAHALDAVGDHAEAFTHMKEYAALREKIYGEERQRAVAEMQARFDVDHAEREREVFRLRSEHLELVMEQRSKELTSMAMHLVQKNAFLQKIRKDAIEIASQHPAAKPAFDELLRAIAENLHDDNDWERFEQEFQLVHPGFVQTISQRYPRLSPTELKVCAMLKINLSNKDITRLLSVSLRNVESHRYSIRKKLGLPSEVNLSSFLAAL